jgi:hypothetical protein
MVTERAIPIIAIVIGSSLVAVAIAGEVTVCQTKVQREGPSDLTHWAWRTIDGKQCWYRGDRWKPTHELRWEETTTSAPPGKVDQPQTDGHTEVAGLDSEPGMPQADSPAKLIGLDAGPTEPTSIDNAPEEWRAQFSDRLLAIGWALIEAASPLR